MIKNIFSKGIIMGVMIFFTGIVAEDLTKEEIQEIVEHCKGLETESDCTSNPKDRCVWKSSKNSLGKTIEKCSFNGNKKKGFEAVENETEDDWEDDEDTKKKKQKKKDKKGKKDK